MRRLVHANTTIEEEEGEGTSSECGRPMEGDQQACTVVGVLAEVDDMIEMEKMLVGVVEETGVIVVEGVGEIVGVEQVQEACSVESQGEK